MISENYNQDYEAHGLRILNVKASNICITLEFDKNQQLVELVVSEMGECAFETTCTAVYNSHGELKYKCCFLYNLNGFMTEYLVFDRSNALVEKTIYESNEKNQCLSAFCYDGKGNLEYTIHHELDHEGLVRINTTYKDANGNFLTSPPDDYLTNFNPDR